MLGTQRRRFASDPLNLTLAAPEVNRCGARGKCAFDATDWLPTINKCWFAARVVAVKQKYALSVDRREAAALERVLAGCASTAMIVTAPGDPAATPRHAADAFSDALRLYDDNRNGRIHGQPLPDVEAAMNARGLAESYEAVLDEALGRATSEERIALERAVAEDAAGSSWLAAAGFFNTIASRTGLFQAAAHNVPDAALPLPSLEEWSPRRR